MPLVVGTNSYKTAAEATAYLADSARAGAWAFFSTTQKETFLISAARTMETITWQGQKTNPAQAMAWPRTGVVDKYGNAVDPNTVPVDIGNGQMELAFDISQDPTLVTQSSTGSNIESVKAGSAAVSFFRPTPGALLPHAAWAILGQYASGGAAAAAFGQPVVGGTEGESQFAGGSPYTVNEGLS